MAFAVLQTEFFPAYDHGEFIARFRTAPDASFAETRGRVDAVLKVIGTYPEVENTYATIAARDSDTVRDGSVYIKLKEKSQRTRSQKQLMADLRRKLQAVPGLILSIEEDPDQMQKPLQANVKGEDIPLLKQYSAALKKELYKVPGMVDLDVSMEQDLPEYRLIVDREKASTLGLGTAPLMSTIGALVGGIVVTTYEDEEGEAVNVRVRLPQNLRQDIRQVGDLKLAVAGQKGTTTLVPIADLVKTERSVSPSEIDRIPMSEVPK